jgi:hypothetical protein
VLSAAEPFVSHFPCSVYEKHGVKKLLMFRDLTTTTTTTATATATATAATAAATTIATTTTTTTTKTTGNMKLKCLTCIQKFILLNSSKRQI